MARKRKDPKTGTGKKPKDLEGDYIPMKIRKTLSRIKYATVADARATARKS